MKTLQMALGIAVVSLVGSGIVTADPSAQAVDGKKKEDVHEKLVFVTGSRIPQRIKVKAIGTNTTSPIRVYDGKNWIRLGSLPPRALCRGIRLSRFSDRATGRECRSNCAETKPLFLGWLVLASASAEGRGSNRIGL